MTLRNRIALTFSVLTTVMLGLVLSVIYLLAARYTEREFMERLEGRAFIAAQAFLEQDELGQKVLAQLRQRHMQTLPDEREFFVRLDQPSPMPADLAQIKGAYTLVERVRLKGKGDLRRGPTSIVGIKYVDNQGVYAAILMARDRYGYSKLNNLQLIMGLALLAYLLVVFFVGRWYAFSVLSPISGIIERMKVINTSNLHLRLEENEQKDELTQLTRTFNRMLDRLETSVEAQNHFIGNASHQLKNPLTAILGEVETALSDSREAPEYRDSLLRIDEEASRLRTLILRLLRLAHTEDAPEENAFGECRIDEILFELADEFHELMPGRHLRIDFSGFPAEAERLTVRAHRNLLKIALSNIIENAFKFSDDQDVGIGLKITTDTIQLDVTDRGIGIPEADLANVFDPFFRAGNARHLPGFGIGLPLVSKIIKMHDGHIRVQSKVGEGACFSVTLPTLN